MTMKLAKMKTADNLAIRLPGFTLHTTGVEVHGRPSFAEYQGALAFAERAYEACGWWVTDLLAYGRRRLDWKERLAAIMGSKRITYETAKNLKYIGENITASCRRDDVNFSVHSEVVSLNQKDQVRLLALAAEYGWTQQDMRREVRAFKRQTIVEGQAVLEGQYRVIYADPPWLYNDRGVINTGDNYGRAERHYPGQTIEELCKLPVAAHARPNSVLFLWVTSPMLSACWPVIEAWGYEYKTSIVWDKVLHNFGHYVSVRHELLLIGTRGSCTPDHPTPMPDSVQTIRRSDVHSEKPAEFRRLIEQLYDGPRLELFARARYEGWTAFGNDARLLAEASA
jgi:N6-adenosine-specific RNA methylase IME4